MKQEKYWIFRIISLIRQLFLKSDKIEILQRKIIKKQAKFNKLSAEIFKLSDEINRLKIEEIKEYKDE